MEQGEQAVTPATGLVIVRDATTMDLDWLVREAHEFSKFNGTKRELFTDDEFARAGFLGFMHQHFLRIAERDGERLGFIAGYITGHPFNPNIRVLCEAMWWVAEQHRHSRAGLMLLNEYTEWGKAHCDWVQFALQSHSPVKEETLTKRGYRKHESSYLLEVD